MKSDIGEQIVGAYLKIIENCNVIDYNVRQPDGGVKGLDELDVIGLDFENSKAFLCEVSTHTRGLVYGSSTDDTIQKIQDKYQKQKVYAKKYLKYFNEKVFMFWSPYVPEGKITEGLQKEESLKLIINNVYTEKVKELIKWSFKHTEENGNTFLRTLQILTHLRGEDVFKMVTDTN